MKKLIAALALAVLATSAQAYEFTSKTYLDKLSCFNDSLDLSSASDGWLSNISRGVSKEITNGVIVGYARGFHTIGDDVILDLCDNYIPIIIKVSNKDLNRADDNHRKKIKQEILDSKTRGINLLKEFK